MIDETLRMSLLGTFLIRMMDKEIELEGYKIPAQVNEFTIQIMKMTGTSTGL